ncbi:helix-turn-helix domain-containing protein [Haloferula sp. A504]|uniref:helix-turn-helix domain-containing protein n=1 Tax=Haloferula sp. A504 TaxID=3373601 RepID=UPI0031BBF9E6|nr:helix-turn-helix domain-containing protein [Verrucomicrobiaceae bacterium E54]
MKSSESDTLSPTDRELLEKVHEVINGKEPPILLGPEGGHIQMPPALFHILTQATRALLSGQSVQILSQGEEFTTQAAANFLGCSRPFLVNLLESGEIPFHFVGTHRRVALKDLQAYRRQRDQDRKASLARLTRIADDEDFEEDSMGGDED